MKKILIIFFIIFILFIVVFPHINKVTIEQLDNIGTVKITINFYAPIDKENIKDKIHIVSQKPEAVVIKNFRWLNDRMLEIFAVEEEQSKGFNINVFTEPLKTKIPGLFKRIKFSYRADVPVYLTDFSPIVPSKGPIVLKFSSPVKKHTIKKNLKVDFDYKLSCQHTVLKNGEIFRDFSKWYIYPLKDLETGKRYDVKFCGKLENMKGSSYEVEFYKFFKVAEKPKVKSCLPKNKQKDVPLYTPIKIEFDQEMADVNIKVNKMMGEVSFEEKTAEFKPYSAFLPNEDYEVKVTGKSIFDESMDPHNYKFTTCDVKDYWVEVNLRPIQKVVVYKGNKAIRTMLASGGLTDDPECITPKGIFYLKERGLSFWTERINEGAYYWVRITGNYLIHSLPRNKEGKIIKEERDKLGIPASHGCIRLRDHDAKWFYDNIPAGTMVVIHD